MRIKIQDMEEERRTMRLNYRFTFGGVEYEGVNVPIGDTTNPDWYREGDKGKRYHKWDAIFKELPRVWSALYHAVRYHLPEYNPSEFGFKFMLIEKGG